MSAKGLEKRCSPGSMMVGFQPSVRSTSQLDFQVKQPFFYIREMSLT